MDNLGEEWEGGSAFVVPLCVPEDGSIVNSVLKEADCPLLVL
jgi:hypothetical protein